MSKRKTKRKKQDDAKGYQDAVNHLAIELRKYLDKRIMDSIIQKLKETSSS